MIASIREKSFSSRLMIATVLFLIAVSAEAFCQESPPPQPQGTPSPNNIVLEAQPEAPLPKAENPQTPSPDAALSPKENTAEACNDRVDNDKDSWVDCDDQDCFCMVFCAQKNKCPQ
ncbi:MAG: hypothetical protein MUC50_17665, partial [Myxococcota bacterium]|nr:hypothetical protein [Myxococcota bacterium]